MSDLVFYHNPMSRGRIVHWMLEETGAAYDVELLSFDRGEHKAPAFLRVNPMGKVPAIVHESVVVTEVGAICAYLADAFPDAQLAPRADSAARGTYYRWLFFGAGCFEPAIIDRMFERPAPDRPGVLGYGSYAQTLDVLEQAVSPGPYLLGNMFSAADVYVGAQIGWGLLTESLEARPAFVEYSQRCASRPAALRAAERDEAFSARMQQAG